MTDREHRIDTGSPEERVKQAYPEAICRDWSYGGAGPFTVMTFAGNAAKIISRGAWTEAAAWADAASRLETK